MPIPTNANRTLLRLKAKNVAAVYLVDAPGSQSSLMIQIAESVDSIDWSDFRAWVLKTHARSYGPKLFNYARKYWFVLRDPARASMLLGMTRPKRRAIMTALANLAKYLGCYDYWRGIVKNHGLKWEKRGGVEAFLSIVNTDLRAVEEWLRTVIQKLPEKLSATLVFQALTGVRPSEACMSVGLVAELSEKGELDGYFNRGLSMLEHFRFPEMFLRRSKNCYISFVSEDVLRLVLEAVRGKITYNGIVSAVQKEGLPLRMLHLRKLYATTLRERGIAREIIDLLQGRIGQSVFLRHYYKPYLAEVKEKVLKAVEPMTTELLSNL